MYELLSLSPTTPCGSVASHGRRMLAAHHPDVYDGDSTSFYEIRDAIKMISNPVARSNYDRFGDLSTFATFKGRLSYREVVMILSLLT